MHTFTSSSNTNLSFQLLPQQRLEGVAILSEFFDALVELVKCHGVLEEGPSELGLVIDERNLGDWSGGSGSGSVKFLGDWRGVVLELLQEGRGNCKEIAAGQSLDLSGVAERSTHDDGLVSVLLVVVVDLADGLNTGVILVLVSGSGLVLLVPVQNTADEGRDEGDTSLSTSNSLAETKQECKVAVDLVVTLEFTGSLDTLPGGSDLDENAFLGDADGLVKLDQVLGLSLSGLFIEREPSIDLRRNATGDDGQNFLSELNEQTVSSVLNLSVDVTTLLFGIRDGVVDQPGVSGLACGSEDKRWVSGSVLRLVGIDGFEVTRVGDNDGASGL